LVRRLLDGALPVGSCVEVQPPPVLVPLLGRLGWVLVLVLV
jgi:hypothetical protein